MQCNVSFTFCQLKFTEKSPAAPHLFVLSAVRSPSVANQVPPIRESAQWLETCLTMVQWAEPQQPQGSTSVRKIGSFARAVSGISSPARGTRGRLPAVKKQSWSCNITSKPSPRLISAQRAFSSICSSNTTNHLQRGSAF